MSVSPNSCPVVNLCHVGNPEAPACGTDREHLVPLPLAEQLCSRALAGRIGVLRAEIEEGAYPANIADDYASAAWLELEFAIARPNSDNVLDHVDRSREYADLAMSQPYSRFRAVYSAALLNAYRQPLLERREQTPTTQDLDTVKKRLGTIYEVLQATPVHTPQVQHILDAQESNQPHLPCLDSEGEKRGFTTKLAGMMLAARQGILLFPASNREAHGIGTWTALNHDAYRVIDGEKQLVKFRNKAKNSAEGEGRQTKYDDSTLFINVRAMINDTLEQLTRDDKRLYRSLLSASGGRPDITEVAELLVAESRGEKLGQQKRQFLDLLGKRLNSLLGEDDGSIVDQPETSEATASSHKTFGKIGNWKILSEHVLSLHNSQSIATPEQQESAASAGAAYLKWSERLPSTQSLKSYLDRMRSVTDPRITAECVGVYVDLARHPETAPEHAVQLIEASQALAETLTRQDWHNLDRRSIQAQHYAALQAVYGEKYKKALSGETPTIDDEARLYLELLELGKDTLAPARFLSESRGSLFELTLHILNARFNVRSGQIIQSAWPALPREDDPRPFNADSDLDGSTFGQFEFTGNTAWDLAITRGDFLAQDTGCRYVQAKSVPDNDTYHPRITTIIGKTDLFLSSSTDIVNDAIAEQTTTDPAKRREAHIRLNNYEERFLNKLGF